MTQMTEEHNSQATDESLRSFFLAGDSVDLNAWNPDLLVNEVIMRYADDAPALRRLQSIVLEACLAAIDRQAVRIDD